jgi:hypothetical protein
VTGKTVLGLHAFFFLPCGQVIDGFRADGQLDEMYMIFHRILLRPPASDTT